MTVLVKIIRN